MLTVGITGQTGFIGTHLFNYLSSKENELILLPFDDSFFEDNKILMTWVKNCDVIVHLAAMNRHEDQAVIYNTNISLVKQLINALEESNNTPHILFSSSSQESRENSYGKSKKEGRELFIKWARKRNTRFTGMVIPNVFGPNGKPFYNSVVATFCYQLTHSEKPKIDIDGSLKLIYVGELAEVIYNIIVEAKSEDEFHVLHTHEIKVSEILILLERFMFAYNNNRLPPGLNSRFEENLYNTFLSFIVKDKNVLLDFAGEN
jgi:UDP-2-acetamido-2,6-beta-L-arabino-hexul-4-ose reductase